jgi:hypothetical protein
MRSTLKTFGLAIDAFARRNDNLILVVVFAVATSLAANGIGYRARAAWAQDTGWPRSPVPYGTRLAALGEVADLNVDSARPYALVILPHSPVRTCEESDEEFQQPQMHAVFSRLILVQDSTSAPSLVRPNEARDGDAHRVGKIGCAYASERIFRNVPTRVLRSGGLLIVDSSYRVVYGSREAKQVAIQDVIGLLEH